MSRWIFYERGREGVTLEGTIQATSEDSGWVQIRLETDEDETFFVECTESASKAMIDSGLHEELEGENVWFTPALKLWGDDLEKETHKFTEDSLKDLKENQNIGS